MRLLPRDWADWVIAPIATADRPWQRLELARIDDLIAILANRSTPGHPSEQRMISHTPLITAAMTTAGWTISIIAIVTAAIIAWRVGGKADFNRARQRLRHRRPTK